MAISKQIEDFTDYYISSAGNVWRKKSNDFYLMLRPSKEGRVNIWTNGERKQMLVHRLVAMAFVPVPEKYADMSIDELDVHHIDHNKKNNLASNLMWLTKAEHMQLHRESEVTKQRRSDARKGENNPMYGKPKAEGAGTPPKAVAQYTKEGVLIATYPSANEAARQTGVNQGNISKCCLRKPNYNFVGGYKWAYLN